MPRLSHLLCFACLAPVLPDLLAGSLVAANAQQSDTIVQPIKRVRPRAVPLSTLAVPDKITPRPVLRCARNQVLDHKKSVCAARPAKKFAAKKRAR